MISRSRKYKKILKQIYLQQILLQKIYLQIIVNRSSEGSEY